MPGPDSTLYPPRKYRTIGHDLVERWDAGQAERDAMRAQANAHFDKARDAALAKLWAEQGEA